MFLEYLQYKKTKFLKIIETPDILIYGISVTDDIIIDIGGYSLLGGMRDTQECIDFCAMKGIQPETELVEQNLELIKMSSLLLASLWRCSFSTSDLRYIDISIRHLGLSVLISSI